MGSLPCRSLIVFRALAAYGPSSDVDATGRDNWRSTMRGGSEYRASSRVNCPRVLIAKRRRESDLPAHAACVGPLAIRC
jgi:hypothetical protein